MRFLFLFFFATNIFALNWKAVSYSDSAVSYVDIDSIKESKGIVYYWNLSDRHKKITVGNITFMSSVSYLMTDCEMNKVKTLSTTFYNKKMAQGDPLYTDNKVSQSWSYQLPGSVGAQVNEYACSLINS